MEADATNEHELSPFIDTESEQKEVEVPVVSGTPVVRASTARPASFEPETSTVSTATDLLSPPQSEKDASTEFEWLFVYGLEMEPARLNSPERLNGFAKRYGPAMVQGYELRGIEISNGRIAPTLVPCEDHEREVWGVLYRVPRRLLSGVGTSPAAPAATAFVPVHLNARETYRNRSIECITYIVSEPSNAAFAILPSEQRRLDGRAAQQLLRIGKQQGLPATYLAELAVYADAPMKDLALPGREQQARAEQSKQNNQVEQDTEPLLALARASGMSVASNDAELPVLRTLQAEQSAQTDGRWLYALSLYLALLMMATLVLAVMQALGFWGQIFASGFMPLGAPWYVLLYGLLGGCISSMASLGRLARHRVQPVRPLPGFVVITWFTRPYLGALLAALAYFLLTSGLFLTSIVPSERYAVYAVAAALAGLCEGRIFFRQ